ncbi:hypothetical protein AB9K34_24000 [Sedimentitalea sp. XS_ASV28]|uniref:hypothetical protein n=1 Tax=Sedimentitalea sp. XS_ASV28 TaxID=3241296 RepID=UPI003511A5ED
MLTEMPAVSHLLAWTQKRDTVSKNRLTLSAKEALRRACPAAAPWLDDEHKLVIERIFAEAEQRSVWRGIPFEVDHIVPLKGRCPHTLERNVCSLHVYWNLRVIPMQVNRSKSDFFDTDWPGGGDGERTGEEGDSDDDIPF